MDIPTRLLIDVNNERIQDRVKGAANERLARSLNSTSGGSSSVGSSSVGSSSPMRSTSISTFFGNLASQFKGLQRQHSVQRCIDSTADSFTISHQEWSDELFDKHFLTARAAKLLEAFVLGKQPYSASDLTQLWVEQFSVSTKHRHWLMTNGLPIAAEFLYVLQAEAASLNKDKASGGYSTETMQFA